jgi:hypothetical protein
MRHELLNWQQAANSLLCSRVTVHGSLHGGCTAEWKCIIFNFATPVLVQTVLVDGALAF